MSNLKWKAVFQCKIIDIYQSGTIDIFYYNIEDWFQKPFLPHTTAAIVFNKKNWEYVQFFAIKAVLHKII